MKRAAFSILFLVVMSQWVEAQEFYAFFTKDVSDYYTGWLLPLEAEVHIVSYDEKQADPGQKENNKKGGIQTGAVFSVTGFGTDGMVAANSVSGTNVRFCDEAGAERFDVKGVTLNVVYKVDGKDWEDVDSFKIVPKSAVSDVENKRMETVNAFTLKKPDLCCNNSQIKGKYILVYNSSKSTVKQISDKINLKKDDKSKSDVTAVEFALSDDDLGIYVPNFTVPVKEFQTESPLAMIADIVLLLFAALSAFLLLRKKGKGEKEEKEDDAAFQPEPAQDLSALMNLKAEEVKRAISGITFEPVQEKLSAIEKSLLDVKSLVTNTDDKKTISKLSADLAQEKARCSEQADKITQARQNLESKTAEISALKDKIEDLERQLVIPGTETVSGADQLVSFALHLLDMADEAETKVVQDWRSIADIGIKERAGYLVSAELSGKPISEIARWRGILSTLKLKSVIGDVDLVKYVKTVSEADRSVFLTKQFIDTVVRPYISNLLVLLEQFRTGAEWGYVSADSDSYANLINELLTVCKGADILVDYRKLYEKLDNYDRVVIDDVVPEPVSGWIDTSRKDVVLYVKNYAVSSELSDDGTKTSCVVLF